MQTPATREVTARLLGVLAAAVKPDGGWPYYEGRSSRLEPTCWAALGLSFAQDAKADSDRVSRARAFLRRLQREDGLLLDDKNPGPNYAWNGLALLADTTIGGPSPDPWRDRLVAGLLAAKGVALEQSSSLPSQNNRLQAWSWIEGTFSWIEPTAVCLTALKKIGAAGRLARTRMSEAESLILDRVCDGGGWNFGNAHVLDQDLRPYVPTTALALLAMQDRRDHPAVKQSLEWLVAHATAERGAMALSLATVCLQIFGEPTDAVRDLLVRQEAETKFLGNAHLTAMALFALTVPRHGAQAFRI